MGSYESRAADDVTTRPSPPSSPAAAHGATGIAAMSAPVRRIAVLMVESHTVVREGLSMLVDAQADLQVVAQAGSLGGALALDVRPDVLLASLDLPDGRGEDVVTSLRQVLGIDTLLMGFGLDDDQIHSPNEKFEQRCFHHGIRSHVRLLAKFAEG